MRLRAGTLGLLLFAGVAASVAGTEDAPLDQTKLELQDLQRDQATKKSEAAAAKLTGSGIQIQSPTAEIIPLDLSTKQQKEDLATQRQKLAQKRQNWLVDGVNQLEKSEKVKGGGETGGKQRETGDDPDGLPDSSDPDYIRKVYDQQKREADTKAGTKAHARAASDPMAPFLQGWLGKPSASDVPFDSLAKTSSADNGATPNNGTLTVNYAQPYGEVRDTAGATRGIEPGGTAPVNPYLQNMETTVLPAAEIARMPAAPPPGMSQDAFAIRPAGQFADPPPVSPPAQKSFLPPSPADENKYFPQLKKF